MQIIKTLIRIKFLLLFIILIHINNNKNSTNFNNEQYQNIEKNSNKEIIITKDDLEIIKKFIINYKTFNQYDVVLNFSNYIKLKIILNLLISKKKLELENKDINKCLKDESTNCEYIIKLEENEREAINKELVSNEGKIRLILNDDKMQNEKIEFESENIFNKLKEIPFFENESNNRFFNSEIILKLSFNEKFNYQDFKNYTELNTICKLSAYDETKQFLFLIYYDFLPKLYKIIRNLDIDKTIEFIQIIQTFFLKDSNKNLEKSYNDLMGSFTYEMSEDVLKKDNPNNLLYALYNNIFNEIIKTEWNTPFFSSNYQKNKATKTLYDKTLKNENKLLLISLLNKIMIQFLKECQGTKDLGHHNLFSWMNESEKNQFIKEYFTTKNITTEQTTEQTEEILNYINNIFKNIKKNEEKNKIITLIINLISNSKFKDEHIKKLNNDFFIFFTYTYVPSIGCNKYEDYAKLFTRCLEEKKILQNIIPPYIFKEDTTLKNYEKLIWLNKFNNIEKLVENENGINFHENIANFHIYYKDLDTYFSLEYKFFFIFKAIHEFETSIEWIKTYRMEISDTITKSIDYNHRLFSLSNYKELFEDNEQENKRNYLNIDPKEATIHKDEIIYLKKYIIELMKLAKSSQKLPFKENFLKISKNNPYDPEEKYAKQYLNTLIYAIITNTDNDFFPVIYNFFNLKIEDILEILTSQEESLDKLDSNTIKDHNENIKLIVNKILSYETTFSLIKNDNIEAGSFISILISIKDINIFSECVINSDKHNLFKDDNIQLENQFFNLIQEKYWEIKKKKNQIKAQKNDIKKLEESYKTKNNLLEEKEYKEKNNKYDLELNQYKNELKEKESENEKKLLEYWDNKEKGVDKYRFIFEYYTSIIDFNEINFSKTNILEGIYTIINDALKEKAETTFDIIWLAIQNANFFKEYFDINDNEIRYEQNIAYDRLIRNTEEVESIPPEINKKKEKQKTFIKFLVKNLINVFSKVSKENPENFFSWLNSQICPEGEVLNIKEYFDHFGIFALNSDIASELLINSNEEEEKKEIICFMLSLKSIIKEEYKDYDMVEKFFKFFLTTLIEKEEYKLINEILKENVFLTTKSLIRNFTPTIRDKNLAHVEEVWNFYIDHIKNKTFNDLDALIQILFFKMIFVKIESNELKLEDKVLIGNYEFSYLTEEDALINYKYNKGLSLIQPLLLIFQDENYEIKKNRNIFKYLQNISEDYNDKNFFPALDQKNKLELINTLFETIFQSIPERNKKETNYYKSIIVINTKPQEYIEFYKSLNTLNLLYKLSKCTNPEPFYLKKYPYNSKIIFNEIHELIVNNTEHIKEFEKKIQFPIYFYILLEYTKFNATYQIDYYYTNIKNNAIDNYFSNLLSEKCTNEISQINKDINNNNLLSHRISPESDEHYKKLEDYEKAFMKDALKNILSIIASKLYENKQELSPQIIKNLLEKKIINQYESDLINNLIKFTKNKTPVRGIKKEIDFSKQEDFFNENNNKKYITYILQYKNITYQLEKITQQDRSNRDTIRCKKDQEKSNERINKKINPLIRNVNTIIEPKEEPKIESEIPIPNNPKIEEGGILKKLLIMPACSSAIILLRLNNMIEPNTKNKFRLYFNKFITYTKNIDKKKFWIGLSGINIIVSASILYSKSYFSKKEVKKRDSLLSPQVK